MERDYKKAYQALWGAILLLDAETQPDGRPNVETTVKVAKLADELEKKGAVADEKILEAMLSLSLLTIDEVEDFIEQEGSEAPLVCTARHPSDEVRCTRPEGHSGPHLVVVDGGEYSWHNKDE